jgi:hypothetical protein
MDVIKLIAVDDADYKKQKGRRKGEKAKRRKGEKVISHKAIVDIEPALSANS